MSPSIALRTLMAVALALVLHTGPVVADAPRALSPAEANLITAALAEAPAQGLPAPDTASAPLETAVIAYAKAQHGARLDLAKVDPDWALRPGAFDAEAGLQSALASGGLRTWLDALEPADERYRALVSARHLYATAAAAGGWGVSPPPPGLKRGSIGHAVATLRARLAAEGYRAAPIKSPGLFDAPLDQALRRFERHHDLAEDGVVSARVLAALNVPPRVRLATIDANLERWRWLPRTLAATRIEVDIATARLVLYQDGAPALAMRTVVGEPKHRTPLLAAVNTGIVINPPWNVPTSIATKELFPREAREPGYFRRNDFSIVRGQLRQAAGPKSALGRLKFDLDDPYEIYLHDTPERGLFALDRRALSHGCVRVERPLDLAVLLLASRGLSRESLEHAIAAKVTRRVTPQARTPVYLLYWTASADADGTVSFHADLYGWDDELNAALATL